MKLSSLFEILTTGRRLEIENYIHREIKIIEDSLEIILNTKNIHDLKSTEDKIEILEQNFSDLILELNKDCESDSRKPFYWTYLYKLCQEIQRVFNIMELYFHQEKIYKTFPSIDLLVQTELNILKNIRNFIDEYIKNRKYVSELLKNNENEIKNFSRIHLTAMEKSHISENSSREKFELLRTLSELNNKNKDIQILLNEIFISSHM